MNNANIKYLLIFSSTLWCSLITGQVKFNISDETVQQVETICLDITVEDFTDILTLQFSINWDPNVLGFVRTENYGIPINPGDFSTNDKSNGKLAFIWSDPVLAPRSVPDGQVLFSICFKASGLAGSESTVRFTDDPTMMDAIDGMGQSIGILAQEANVEVTQAHANQDALELYYDDITFNKGESFCVPIRAGNFESLTAVQFSLKFNNNRFRFDKIQNIENWNGSGFVAVSTHNATNGEIAYAYIDFSFDANGNSLNDGDVLLELCLTHILNEDCFLEEVIISDSPIKHVATKAPGDFEVPLNYNAGKIKLACIIPTMGNWFMFLMGMLFTSLALATMLHFKRSDQWGKEI